MDHLTSLEDFQQKHKQLKLIAHAIQRENKTIIMMFHTISNKRLGWKLLSAMERTIRVSGFEKTVNLLR